jgi:hypothetical protein
MSDQKQLLRQAGIIVKVYPKQTRQRNVATTIQFVQTSY